MLFTFEILILTLSALQGALAHPLFPRAPSGLDVLVKGNKEFQAHMKKENPGLLKKLAKGQEPPFMVVGCADSRSSEGKVFNAKPGTIFTQRNIANQFLPNDTNAHSVLAYGVSALGVQHVFVMGHYGCGGVAAAMQPAPKLEKGSAMQLVMDWITPIREIYRTSDRKEIVDYRKKNKGKKAKEPKYNEPAFRALIEENVKASVRRVADSTALKNHNDLLERKGKRASKKAPVPVFVHGVVYDIESGEVRDLDVSVGPPGSDVPKLAFPKVKAPKKNAVKKVIDKLKKKAKKDDKKKAKKNDEDEDDE